MDNIFGNTGQKATEMRLRALEQKVLHAQPLSEYASAFTVVPAYVVEVSDDGSRILVSPWGSDEKHEATQLSPIPTSLEDGRRLQGIPTAKFGMGGEYAGGDNVLCVIIDIRWYILGYFNLPETRTSEKVSLIKDQETISPFRNGIMLKISKFGQIVIRKTNQIKTFLGPWAESTVSGVDLDNEMQDPTHFMRFANIIQRSWGGLVRSIRKRADAAKILWATTHTSAQSKSYEPDILSDVDLEQKVKNENIEETTAQPGSSVPAKNKKDLGYVDKVIKRSGTIRDETHVYERETRGSKEADKEKTQFTRLREGNREGVLSEYETIDTLLFTQTVEKRGAFDDGRLAHNSYVQASDADGTVTESLAEQFGNNGTDLYNWKLTNADGKTITIQATNTGFNVVLDDDEATLNLDSKLITFGRAADTPLTRFAELKVVLDDMWAHIQNHDHNTGVGPSTPANAGVYFPTKAARMAPTGMAADIDAIASEVTTVK